MTGGILIVLGILCLVYFAGIVFYVGLSSKFPLIWVAVGALFIGSGGISLLKVEIPDNLEKAGIMAVILALLVFIAVEGRIVKAMYEKAPSDLDFLIVLGAQVKGDKPSLSLLYRIEQAEIYLSENAKTRAILSGGKGRGEEISEAECMCRELIKLGIPKERLTKEEQSTSTYENILFSKEILEREYKEKLQTCKVGIVTNNFHVFRGKALGKKKLQGQIWGIGAKGNRFLLANYMLREFFCILKDKILGNL